MTKPLAIVPTYLRRSLELEVVAECLRSLRATAGQACEVLVVDDYSPARDLVEGLGRICGEHDADLVCKDVNEGFSRAVNVGLQFCLDEERDAVLINSDIEFSLGPEWLDLMQQTVGTNGEPASVVGALLLYPGGELIQHSGIYFSNLTRTFSHRFMFGPVDLPEAQQPTVCPVTGALQFIRHECLEAIGPYDPSFSMGFEDVDFCLRAMLSGREVIYQPGVRAIHHESLFRGNPTEKIKRWTDESWRRFCAKYGDVNLAALVPSGLYPR